MERALMWNKNLTFVILHVYLKKCTSVDNTEVEHVACFLSFYFHAVTGVILSSLLFHTYGYIGR